MGSFANLSFPATASLRASGSFIVFAWSACLAILDKASFFLVDSGFGLFSPTSSMARPPLIKAGIGAMPLRLKPVKLFVTMPSLSSLAWVPRLEETETDAGDNSSSGGGLAVFFIMIAVGADGAILARFGRGIVHFGSGRFSLKQIDVLVDQVDEVELR